MSNTRHQSTFIEGASGYGVKEKQFHHAGELIWLFNRHVKDKSFMGWNKEEILRTNRLIFQKEVDTTEIEFTLEELEKIYNTNNFDYLNRTAMADYSYMKRRSWNRLLWIWKVRLESWQKRLSKGVYDDNK